MQKLIREFLRYSYKATAQRKRYLVLRTQDILRRDRGYYVDSETGLLIRED